MTKTLLQPVLLIAVLVMLLHQGWQEVKAQGAEWLPVKFVKIEGAFQYIKKEKIKQVLLNQVMSGFFNVDLQQIQLSVEQLPWVEEVKVKRVWPEAIDISIKEQTPAVRWGEESLLNEYGEKFVPENIADFGHLPLIIGPYGYEKKLLKTMAQLKEELQRQGMVLAEFEVNERRAWKIKLHNKMELILGRNEPIEKFKRFLKTIVLLGKEQVKKIAVVDLRYSNGYALTWKQDMEEIDWKIIAKENKRS